jgi:hypothetical protein
MVTARNLYSLLNVRAIILTSVNEREIWFQNAKQYGGVRNLQFDFNLTALINEPLIPLIWQQIINM